MRRDRHCTPITTAPRIGEIQTTKAQIHRIDRHYHHHILFLYLLCTMLRPSTKFVISTYIIQTWPSSELSLSSGLGKVGANLERARILAP